MKTMFNKIKAQLVGFKENVSGTVSVEAVIMLPLLLWVVAAMAVFLDVFRTKSAMDKAAFTISDALSRETNAITPSFLDNAHTLFNELADIDEGSSIRVSLVEFDGAVNNYEIAWSQTRGDAFYAMTNDDVQDLAEYLPPIDSSESLILVESHYTYEPLYDIGVIASGYRGEVDEDNIIGYDEETGEPIYQGIAWDLDMGMSDMMTFVFTRPRYASQLVYDAAG